MPFLVQIILSTGLLSVFPSLLSKFSVYVVLFAKPDVKREKKCNKTGKHKEKIRFLLILISNLNIGIFLVAHNQHTVCPRSLDSFYIVT